MARHSRLAVLIIHREFPGQYLHLSKRLLAAGHDVVAIGGPGAWFAPGIRGHSYAVDLPRHGAEPSSYFHNDTQRSGVAVASICASLKQGGFTPDLVLGHSGWGEILFIKDVWPRAKLLGYFEFFYRLQGLDVGFDPETPVPDEQGLVLRTRNLPILGTLHAVDAGQTPTRWQHALFPPILQSRLAIIHEGIDTATIRPNDRAALVLGNGRRLGTGDEIVTFVARSLEPTRGFHIFMRSLQYLLAMRPDVQVLIVGADDAAYGPSPRDHASWRASLLSALHGRIDLRRIHFLGHLPSSLYLRILQISTVHVYLTYPFILSWSLIEALSAGCVVVASRTGPVEEVIVDGLNGFLVDFFDAEALARRVDDAITSRGQLDGLRQQARRTAEISFDIDTVIMPRYEELLKQVTAIDAWGLSPDKPGSCSA